MPFTKEHKILIKNSYELKGYSAKHLVRVSQQKLECHQRLQVLQVVAIATGYWVGRPSFQQWQMTQLLH